MKPLKLKQLLADIGATQKALADVLGCSPAAVAQICNHNQWPRSAERSEIQAQIRAWLISEGVATEQAATAFEPEDAATSTESTPEETEEDETMLLRKQTINQTAKKHFNLFRDPFAEPQDPDDLFNSPDIRYAREAMYQTAAHGGFMALVGESGSGKSTLRRDLIERIKNEGAPIITIEPYVLGMEEDDKKGQSLKASAIADAIIATVAPGVPIRRTQDAKYRQLHHVLRESSRGGNRHVLIIEEAHALPKRTLKHLKRFHELEDGFRKLLSIVLIGQPEMHVRLSETDPEIREVVQRCEVATLEPIQDLAGFLRHRFTRVGAELDRIVDRSGIDALQERLTPQQTAGRHQRRVSLVYPLAVQNLLSAALNLASDPDFAVPVVSRDVVMGV